MTRRDDGIYDALVRRGVSRRSFMKFAMAMTAALALPAAYAPRIAQAVATAPRVPVIWLRGQDCSGNTMSFLRSADPTVVELLLDLLSLDYHETLMASAGASADLARVATMEKYPNGYIAVVEGGIPTADDGVYCMIGGRPFRDVVREVTAGALATIAVGSCAFDGGLPAASGGPTGAVGVGQVASGGVIVNLPGCPMNVDNLTATIVHYLTWKQWPVTDSRQRPLFAYGGLIHNQCERRAHFEFGEFVLAWGDEASQKGWCLYKMGCTGPEAYGNCPSQQFDAGTSWPVRAGGGCIGCTMPGFWDEMSPFYRRLQSPIPFAIAPNASVDQVGAVLIGGVAALTVVHGTATYVRERRTMASKGRAARKAAAAAATDATLVPAAEPVAAVAVAPPPVMEAPFDVPPAAPPDAEVR